MSSLRDKIRESEDRPEQIIHVDVWDIDLLLIAMSARERAKWEGSVKKFKDGNIDDAEIAAEMAILSARDPESRKLIFEPTDRAWLVEKNAVAVNRIGVEWLRVSGMLPSSVEEAVKNSEAAQTDSSTLH